MLHERIPVGGVLTLAASRHCRDGAIRPLVAGEWTTSDEATLTVDVAEDGLAMATGKAPGVAILRVSDPADTDRPQPVPLLRDPMAWVRPPASITEAVEVVVFDPAFPPQQDTLSVRVVRRVLTTGV